jgi:hypothetical protein
MTGSVTSTVLPSLLVSCSAAGLSVIGSLIALVSGRLAFASGAIAFGPARLSFLGRRDTIGAGLLVCGFLRSRLDGRVMTSIGKGLVTVGGDLIRIGAGLVGSGRRVTSV